MNIILLAAGLEAFSRKADEYPLYLSERNGVSLLESLLRKCLRTSPDRVICLFSAEDISRFKLNNMLRQLDGAVKLVSVPSLTAGAACSALLASEFIDNDSELLMLNANELLEAELGEILTDFRTRPCDAGVVTFSSLHPRYSFVRVDEAGYVSEAAEKNPISSHAVAGFYWFRHGRHFVEAAKSMIRKDAHSNGVFYVTPSLNEMILAGKRVSTYSVLPASYLPLKSSAHIHKFEVLSER
ncbi:glycosyltransferase family 2 protein [Stutzerimonas stutzeri]|uniref:glycosyltransferase family 2 protein n=1 Tax=Stutzerimonas stutzeri TaxID=316 RepID=UPI000F781F57|nr:glycosyltransferase family 2 protein [Stutzerimonas stutzeri]RRV80972.1 glycosyl transferase family 2 [Stutzerimonas stutzeri]